MNPQDRNKYPTPYEDLNAVLQDFAVRIQTILEEEFVGFYLCGSLSLGDFDPLTSDIDFTVVTQTELAAGLIAALQKMHIEFDTSGSVWAGRIEAAYIPLEALKNTASTTTAYPQVEKGTELFLAPLETGWAFQRHTLREHGVIVAGANPVEYTDPTDINEMQHAARVILGGWHDQARLDPDWITWVRERGCQAFVVLTICRLLYSTQTGAVASKVEAARWAQNTLGTSWESLIQRALNSQGEKQEISDSELQETLDFLYESLERVQTKQ